MQNNILLLEKIQKIDLEIKSIQDGEKACLAGIESSATEAERLKASLDAVSAEVEAVKAQAREIEVRLAESSERISRDEKRLGSVKNDKEMHAVNKEIAAALKVKKQGEQEKAALDQRLAEKSGRLAAALTALEQKEAEHRGFAQEIEEKRPEWLKAIEERLQERDVVASGVRADILKAYENIRSRRGGIGIAPIRGEICQGCYTHIPPQVYIQLKKGMSELETCPHCHRILYVEGQMEAV